jgi:spore germination protein GerM
MGYPQSNGNSGASMLLSTVKHLTLTASSSPPVLTVTFESELERLEQSGSVCPAFVNALEHAFSTSEQTERQRGRSKGVPSNVEESQLL